MRPFVVIESPKRCTKCLRDQPRSEFHGSRNRRDGKHPWCRDCASAAARIRRANPVARQKIRDYQRGHARTPNGRAKQREYNRSEAGKATKKRHKLKAKYGLSESQFLSLKASQGDACPGCGSPFEAGRVGSVDHCHATGKIRGVLCRSCNLALGHVGDSAEILENLAAYLRRCHETGHN